MRKWISLLLALALLLPMAPWMAARAEAAETDELQKTITEQYDAYAASIAQPGADEAAIRQLLNHSLSHPGQLLAMDESDPLTASLFQTELFRTFMTEALTYSVETMQSEHEDRLLIGTSGLSWHDYALFYRVSRLGYTEEIETEYSDVLDRPIGQTEYTGPRNEHDKAMMLIVGGVTVRMWMNQVYADSEKITYRVRLYLWDEFSFDSKYEDAADMGYDVSTSTLINLVGKLFLNEYEWTTQASFEITVPNYCTHESASYRWEFNGTDLENESGAGFNANPLTRIQKEAADGTLRDPYYRTEDTVSLRHDLPWVVEYRIKGSRVFIMAPFESSAVGMPYLLKSHDHVFGGEFYKHSITDPETGKEQIRSDRMQYGVNLRAHDCNGRHLHTYRLENRVAEDGSNMVWLSVDGVEFGPMDNYFLNISSANYDQGQRVNWFNGRDISINYIFNSGWGMTQDTEIEYVRIWENGEGNAPYSYFETTIAAPTCTEPGKIVHTCALCGASYSEETGEAALSHAWDDGVVTTPATCTAEGVMTYTCANDPSHTKTEPVPATGHSPVVDAAVSAGCTADGLTEGSHCETCGEVLTAQETITALGHNWDEGSEVTKPTVNAPGTMMYTCTACGELRSEEVPYESHVSRLAGEHRYETAFKAADQMKENLGIKKFDSIVVASGTNFADALSGSYLAAVKNAPILLACDVEWVNDLVKDYIYQNLNENGTVYILGGEGAVPASFEKGLEDFEIERLAGGNRFETNLLVLEEAGVGDKPILVCTGLDFADSLSASATKLPILLVYGDKLLDDQTAFLKANQGRDLYILGGEGAVSEKLESALTAYGTVERVAGNNRFETSTLIAEKFFTAPESAVLAYAWDFPDGLCGGPLATTMNAPLILTMANYEAKAAEYIQSNAISNAVILGGETLIPESSVGILFAETNNRYENELPIA